MLIITGILLIAIVGLLWTVVLSLIEADGRDDNGRTAPKKRNGAWGHTLNGRREVRIFYTVFTPRLVK